MPRYFLNVICGQHRVIDTTGLDISLDDLILSEITRAVALLREESIGANLSGCEIEVLDSKRTLIMRLDLDALRRS